MLTVAKLAILIKYHWTERLFLKQGTAEERALLAGIDWNELAELLQDLKLYHQQLLAPDYAQRLHGRLLASCADEETAQTLIGYASTL
jgi:hypothetical protein